MLQTSHNSFLHIIRINIERWLEAFHWEKALSFLEKWFWCILLTWNRRRLLILTLHWTSAYEPRIYWLETWGVIDPDFKGGARGKGIGWWFVAWSHFDKWGFLCFRFPVATRHLPFAFLSRAAGGSGEEQRSFPNALRGFPMTGLTYKVRTVRNHVFENSPHQKMTPTLAQTWPGH